MILGHLGHTSRPGEPHLLVLLLPPFIRVITLAIGHFPTFRIIYSSIPFRSIVALLVPLGNLEVLWIALRCRFALATGGMESLVYGDPMES